MSYINLFYIFIVLAIVLLLLSIVLFFCLDIPNAIRIVQHKPPKKKGQKRLELAKDNVKISAKSVGVKKKNTVNKKTTVLQKTPNKKTTILQPNKDQKQKTTCEMKNANELNNSESELFEVTETQSFMASDNTAL